MRPGGWPDLRDQPGLNKGGTNETDRTRQLGGSGLGVRTRGGSIQAPQRLLRVYNDFPAVIDRRPARGQLLPGPRQRNPVPRPDDQPVHGRGWRRHHGRSLPRGACRLLLRKGGQSRPERGRQRRHLVLVRLRPDPPRPLHQGRGPEAGEPTTRTRRLPATTSEATSPSSTSAIRAPARSHPRRCG